MTEVVYPLLPLREFVIFPHMRAHLRVGRRGSLASLRLALADPSRAIVLAAQVDRRVEQPVEGDLFPVGVLARLVEPQEQLPGGDRRVVRVCVEGLTRIRLRGVQEGRNGAFTATVEEVKERGLQGEVAEELRRNLLGRVNELARYRSEAIDRIDLLGAVDLGVLVDKLCGCLDLDLLSRQELLEELDVRHRAQAILRSLELELAEQRNQERMAQGVRRRARRKPRKGQVEKAEPTDPELDELRARIASLDLTEEARARTETALGRLAKMHAMSAEANVLRNWLEVIAEIPWGHFTDGSPSLAEARQCLDEDHCGLDDPKERILEHLAVRSQVPDAPGPILCLVGPPGVGKTSLARSVARATARPFVRVALGGVHDEAQIRGHRRTYVGAMPGRIAQAVKRAGALDAVMLLDEVDKLTADLRGDPAAALLEVLDPEQNREFVDNYLELDLDLSQILFLCTANSLANVPPALRDRLEIIELSGYTEVEKLAIARNHLVPRQAEGAGLRPDQVNFSKPAMLHLIRRYTREAGVRSLERQIGACMRKVTRQLLEQEPAAQVRTGARRRLAPRHVSALLGTEHFAEPDHSGGDRPGLACGLAWSSTGGSVLHIEASVVPGTARVETTGRLGDVMQESARTALTFIRSRAGALGLDRDWYQRVDVHVHAPEGATPKDGPSAGITLVTAIVSALLDRPVVGGLAMTGEVTLRGRVLRIGGLREKLLAAHRFGFDRVLIPRENLPDLDDVPAEVLKELSVTAVAWVDEVLQVALDLPDLELEPLAPDGFLGGRLTPDA
ncbi:MAG: endopeptidase La [Myxococcales bacterium]|nr:endopeptidase La [Myxococcales bacterium]